MRTTIILALLISSSPASAMAIIPRNSQCELLEALEREWRGRVLTPEQKREKARLAAWYSRNCKGNRG